MAPSRSPPGTILLWLVAPSPLFGVEDGGGVDETGTVVVEGCRARNSSRLLSPSPADESDTSEVDDCPLSDGVRLSVVGIAEVAEVGVASGPRS